MARPRPRLPILIIVVLWILAILSGHWMGGRIRNPWMWVQAVEGPLLTVLAFALLSPVPWLWADRFRPPWPFYAGLLLAFLGCQTVSILLVLVDALVLTLGHFSFDINKVLLIYSSTVGPAMMVVGGLIAARTRLEERLEASRSEAQVARTRLLQSQVHPHVLFNALNGLAELVHRDPPAAEKGMRHLSELLRRLMRASEQAAFPLAEERCILADYLAMEAIRLGPRLRVEWAWDSSLDGEFFPPLLLQPLVENAIKHGIAPSVDGGELVIRANRHGQGIAFEVYNTGEPFQAAQGGLGIGVGNLRSRLALAYGTNARLTLGPSGPGTLARIELNERAMG